MPVYFPSDWPYSATCGSREDDPYSPDFDGSLQERELEQEIDRVGREC